MDIKSIITEEEFNNAKGKDLTYDKFCDLIKGLVKLSVEESLRALPTVMTSLSNQASYLKGISDDFYSKNKDLNNEKNRKIVAETIERIESKNPGKKYSEILALAADEARGIISKVKKSSVDGDIELGKYDSRLKDL